MSARNEAPDNSLYKFSTNDPEYLELQGDKLKNIQKIHLIKQLNSMIGVKHSWDMIKIERKTIEDIVPFILKNEDYITTLFNFKKRDPVKKKSEYSITIELLKNIYSSWSMVQFNTNNVEKKKIEHYMFQLSPIYSTDEQINPFNQNMEYILSKLNQNTTKTFGNRR